MEYITNLFSAFISVMKTFGVADVLDVAVVSFIIYSLIKLVRETRAEQLVKGILILVLAYVLSSQLNLKMLSTLLNNFFQFGVLALLVVFQPELRSALEQIGRSKIGNYWSFSSPGKEGKEHIQLQKKAVSVVAEAAALFQKDKVGALIVFERKTKLGDIIDTGTLINAEPSVALLGNIFYNKAPLHDGAMIMKNGLVCAAGCILPLTKNENISIDLGTRHRAAMGMSENSDAVIVVVSEETGGISVAMSGVLRRNYTRQSLKTELEELLLPQVKDQTEKKPARSYFRKAKKDEENKDKKD